MYPLMVQDRESNVRCVATHFAQIPDVPKSCGRWSSLFMTKGYLFR